MNGGLIAMANEERTQPSTDERKELLLTIADLRQGFALSMANIRAYALTGEDAVHLRLQEELDHHHRRAWPSWRRTRPCSPTGQKVTFGMLQKQMAIIVADPAPGAGYPERRRLERGAVKLNNEVTPTFEAILDLLGGKPGEDGQRHGGLVERQADSLKPERQPDHHRLEAAGADHPRRSGSAASWRRRVIAFVVIRALTRPISRLTGAMGQLSGGDLEVAVPDAHLKNEMGAMARALEVFKTSMIQARALDAQQKEEQVVARGACRTRHRDHRPLRRGGLGHPGRRHRARSRRCGPPRNR